MMAYIKYIYKSIFILSLMFLPCLAGYSTADAETVLKDDAGIISGSKEEDLQNLCDKIFKEYSTSVYIWTSPYISGSMDFGHEMEQFVSAQQDTDVIILMIGMYPGDRIYEIQGYGVAKDMLTDRRCGKILDCMHSYMTDGQYYAAVEKFCNMAYTYMGRPPKLDSMLFSPIVQFILCLLAGIVSVALAAHNSGMRITVNSYTYLNKNNSRVIGRFDRYTHTTVTRTPKPKTQSGSSRGGGGGSSHSSGGGRSF